MITVILPYNTPFHKKYRKVMADIIGATIDKFLQTSTEYTDAAMMVCLQKIMIREKTIRSKDKQGVIRILAVHLKKQFTKEKLNGVMFMLGYACNDNQIEIHLYHQDDEIYCKKVLGYTYAECK